MEETPSIDWTLIVAAYGAILASIVAAYNAISEWRLRRPHIKVGVSMSVFDSFAGSPTDTMVFLVAANPGNKVVTVGWMGLVLPNRAKVTLTDPEGNVSFPHKLLPEESCQVWIEASKLATHLRSEGFSEKVKLVGFYKDVIGRTYKSKPFEFDLDDDYA